MTSLNARERLKANAEKRAAETRQAVLPDGSIVSIRNLNEREQVDLDVTLFDKKTGEINPERLRVKKWKTLARVVIDQETGNRLYGDDEWEEFATYSPDDVAAIYAKHVENQPDTVKEIEGAVKNSG